MPHLKPIKHPQLLLITLLTIPLFWMVYIDHSNIHPLEQTEHILTCLTLALALAKEPSKPDKPNKDSLSS